MSVFEEEWEDYELDKYQFEQWLDSINDSGDPEKDEEYYNKEMVKQAEYPEVVIQSPKYTMTYSNN
jgi:hypothetical protein